MKIWIGKNSEISVREQIVTQIKVGVASGDLLPGEKLPSTREIARRFGIHPNTVSAAYRHLSAEGVITMRKGSGVFVRETAESAAANEDIDRRLYDFVARSAAAGFTREQIGAAMHRWLNNGHRPTIVVIESDRGLREILTEEIRSRLGCDVAAAELDELKAGRITPNAIIASLFDEKDKVLPHIPQGQKAVFLKVNSVPASLSGYARPGTDELVAVVSGWGQFIAFARVYLAAVSIAPESLIVRSTDEPGWNKGLEAASIIICDSFTATKLPSEPKVKVFRLVSDESVAELKYSLL